MEQLRIDYYLLIKNKKKKFRLKKFRLFSTEYSFLYLTRIWTLFVTL